MIQRVVDFSLRNRFLVLAMGIVLLLWGAYSFHTLPVEAYPDVADTYVNIITQWPGRAAEEVEQQVTIPIETQMNGVAHLTHLRSVSEFGLSSVTLIFDEQADDLVSRQQALEKLTQVSLPPNLTPQLGPDYSPVGQIYFFTLASSNPLYDTTELKSIEDWLVEKQFKSVPNVVDVSSFGGITREYQVQLDPNRLVEYGLSISQVEQALANNNVNAGGSFIEHGPQAFNIRTVGLMKTTADIAKTVLKAQNGTAIRVGDLGDVVQGPRIRLGKLGKTILRDDGRAVDYDDVIEGIVLLRKGAETESTLEGIHEKVKELNTRILPPGVKIVPHLDRGDLVHYTTHTVLHNLGEGILLVIIVLFLMLGNVRSALIVAATMPFALLFAAILLDLKHIPANLLSLGALDFGMIVDGTVFMVENILRHVGNSEASDSSSMMEKIADAVHEVQRPVFYAVLIIITAYVPIFTLQRVEGRLFRPMSWTVAFALLGALLFALIIAPVLASFVFRPGMKEWRNPVLEWLKRFYRVTLKWCFRFRWVVFAGGLGIVAATVLLVMSGIIGSEFLPHLDEGAIWARGTLAPSTGPSEGERLANDARRIFAAFPEVTKVVSQVGRPDDGSDATGFFNTEYFVDLKPREEWRSQFRTKEELIAAMDERLEKIPGVLWNFSQPIADNMEEAVSGVKGELAIKVFGDDLKQLEHIGDEIVNTMSRIRGVQDLGIFRVIGQPNVNLVVNRDKAERYGINVSDVQDAIETAAGGKAVSQILKGEARYDLVVRYQEQDRRTIGDIANIRILSPSGERVSIAQLCDIKVEDGASQIFREANSRYVAIKYSVRGRDLASTVQDAMQAVNSKAPLPKGYKLEWAGEFESQQRANRRMAIIVPVTLLVILLILHSMFHSFKWAGMVLLSLATVPIGGLVALLLTRTHLSVSSGVGFLALFGVSVQVGVLMLEYINQLRARGHTIEDAALEGAVKSLRPILTTMLVATLGLVPAATSHGIGSDSQRPFAIVIVGGLLANLFLSVLIFPTLYTSFASASDELRGSEVAEGEAQ
jgi:cobalt-zinc-cadmium resistance protein CzcA